METKSGLVSIGGEARRPASSTNAQGYNVGGLPGRLTTHRHRRRRKRYRPPLVGTKWRRVSTGEYAGASVAGTHRQKPYAARSTRTPDLTSPPMASNSSFTSTGGDNIPNRLHQWRHRRCCGGHPWLIAIFPALDPGSRHQISFGGVKNGLRLHVWRRLRGLSPQVASSAPSLLGSSSAGLPLAFMRPRPPPPRPRADSRRGPGRIPAAARAASLRWPGQIPAGGKNNDPAYHGLDRTRHLLPSVVF